MKNSFLVKLCALLLVFCMTPAANVLAAGWTYDSVNDGHSYKENEQVLLFDVSSTRDVENAGFKSKTNKDAGGGKLAHWANFTSNMSIPIRRHKDWSEHCVLNFRVYNATSASASIQIRPTSPRDRYNKDNFFHYTISTDFVGWKDYSLSIPETFSVNFHPDISNISNIAIVKYSGSEVPQLYFDDFYLTSDIREEADVKTLRSTDYYSEEKGIEAEKALKAGVAFYAYTPEIVKDGDKISLDSENKEVTPIFSHNIPMVPASFFKDHLGCEVSEENGVYTVSKDGNTVSFIAESKEFTLNGEKKSFETNTKTVDRKVYVDAIVLASALGYRAQGYNEKRLVIIGADELVEKFNEDQELVGAACWDLVGEYDASKFTDEDFELARQNWIERFCGSEELNDLSDATIKKKIDTITDNALKNQRNMKRSENPVALWGESVGTISYWVEDVYTRIYTMAVAYGTYGSPLYKDKQLKNDILYALDWAYNNVYGQQEINEKGWRSIYIADWWHWKVGGPQKMLPSLLIMQDEISEKDLNRYLELYKFVSSHSRTSSGKSDATSRILVDTLCAIIEKDRAAMNQRNDDFNIIIEVSNSGELFQEDYNYQTHGIPYVISYGLNNLERGLEVMSILADTPLAFTSPRLYNQMKMMELGYRPAIYKSRGMQAFNGRGMQRGYEYAQVNKIALGFLPLIGVFGEEEDAEIKSFVRSLLSEIGTKSILSEASIYQYTLLNDLLNEKTDGAEQDDYEIAQVYYTGDILVQQRNNYAFCLRMFSNRIGNYESCDGENGRGWYTGDGALYFYTDHDKNSFDGPNFLQSDFVAYAIPGTTEDVQERIDWNTASPWKSSKYFVGGNEYEKKYITAAYDYEAFHNDKHPTGDDSGYGGQHVYKECTLTAKKSYFFFDDEVVCLGADITANEDYQVNTYIETRRLIKTAFEGIKTDNEAHYVVDITATGDDGNIPTNVDDNSYDTRWSYQGKDNAYLVMEFEEEVELGYIAIAQYSGDAGNRAIFEIEVSNDGKEWTEVYRGMSSGKTAAFENFDLGKVRAKYVRYSGHGRETSSWNSITEIKVYPGDMPETVADDPEKVNGAEDITVNGELIKEKKEYVKEYKDPEFFTIEGYGGYYLPSGGNLVIEKTNTQPNAFVKAYLNHGKSPKNQSYEYAILPYKTAEEMKAYTADPDIEVLSNTSKVQAVRDKKLDLVGIIFWEAGTFNGITVTEPCIVMYGKEEGQNILTVCDPTQRLTNIKVTVNENVILDISKSDNRFTSKTENGKITLDVNVKNSLGKTYKAVLEK